jgi:hypothetical protein
MQRELPLRAIALFLTMRLNTYHIILLTLTLALTGCMPAATHPTLPESQLQTINELFCPGVNVDCLGQICPPGEPCPLALALNNPDVYNFVAEYAPCPGCAIEPLPIEQGIQECIQYQVEGQPDLWLVDLWVSERCNFRYASPSQSRIQVTIDRSSGQIVAIQPPATYIQDGSYCQSDADCYCLSGSGAPFLGCCNALYAPLHIAGYQNCGKCVCRANRCQVSEKPWFGIYLAHQNLPIEELRKLPLESIEIQTPALISDGDLISYDWDTHTLALNAQAQQRLLAQFSMPIDVDGVPFVVYTGEQPIYLGAFWTPLSSLSFDGVFILQSYNEDMSTLRLELGYPSQTFAGQDPRNDPRLYQALLYAGKLK